MTGYRIKYKNIISELYLPNTSNGATLIFLPGLPSYLGKNQIAKEFTEAGFVVFQPFYSGSFDSAGSFSPTQCIVDIQLFLEMAKQSTHKELYFNAELKIKTKKIILGGTSFGGSIAAIASIHKDIFGILLVNPVLEYGTLEGFKKDDASALLNLLKNAYPFTYRIEDFSAWNTFLLGQDLSVNPLFSLAKHKKNIWIVEGEKDASIPLSVNKRMIEKNLSAQQYELFVIPNAGHSISSFPIGIWGKIANKINETSS